jgi:hypothetical protein
MDSPILTPVSWAKGKYNSYPPHPNGTLIGLINPPGLAYHVNKDPRLTVDDNILFLCPEIRDVKANGSYQQCSNNSITTIGLENHFIVT